MTEAIVISTTTATRDIAEAIANALLEARLAACVQMLSTDSRYVWQGETVAELEVLLLIKTRADLYAAVEAEILRIHPYETPEIIATPITFGHGPYLAWIDETTRSRT